MTHLRLVAGTDMTRVPRRRPRARQASKNLTEHNQTPIHVGAILAAPIEAHESETASSAQRNKPARTDISDLTKTERSVGPSEENGGHVEEKAREALRKLKLPGQEKTLGELRDEVSRRCRKGGTSNPLFERFWAVVSSLGISLRYGPTGRNGDIEFRCVVKLRDELVAAHPEFKPFVFVLEDLEF